METYQIAILLIDADTLLYRATISTEHEVEWEEDLWSLWCDHREARAAFKEMLSQITDKAPEATPWLCLSDNENFRKAVYPPYKANRKALRKPTGFVEFKAWVQDNYDTITKPGIEADDVVGILATKPGNEGSIICSPDKDLLQIPGVHLDGRVLYRIEPKEADNNFYTQVLIGDTTDNYPGCPGIGKAKAAKILAQEGDTWANIVQAYHEAQLTEEDALTQARVARILRWDDWDQKGQKVKLWNPNAGTAA